MPYPAEIVPFLGFFITVDGTGKKLRNRRKLLIVLAKLTGLNIHFSFPPNLFQNVAKKKSGNIRFVFTLLKEEESLCVRAFLV